MDIQGLRKKKELGNSIHQLVLRMCQCLALDSNRIRLGYHNIPVAMDKCNLSPENSRRLGMDKSMRGYCKLVFRMCQYLALDNSTRLVLGSWVLCMRFPVSGTYSPVLDR